MYINTNMYLHKICIDTRLYNHLSLLFSKRNCVYRNIIIRPCWWTASLSPGNRCNFNQWLITECKNNSITSFHDRPRSHICPVNRYLRVFVCDATSSFCSPARPDTNDGISKYSEENPVIPLGNCRRLRFVLE